MQKRYTAKINQLIIAGTCIGRGVAPWASQR
jgi:hypothetical protein